MELFKWRSELFKKLKISVLNLKPKEVFKGLLNLDKDIVLWIDASTKTPLFISTKVPFGFVANLGFIALAGMIMRNSVILVDQIRQDEEAGKHLWEAIIGSTVRRFRPIALTASAAILAMIPLTRQVFWGPMAVSIMGGLVIATLLTCLFLPALYAAWYRVKEEVVP